MTKKKPKARSKGTGAEEMSAPSRLKFDFIKSNGFRVIYVDGVWGGIRPDLTFHMSLYNERHAIPRSITVDLDPENLTAGQVVEVEKREAVVREVEVCAIIDMSTAKALKDWLEAHIEEAEQRLKAMTHDEEETN